MCTSVIIFKKVKTKAGENLSCIKKMSDFHGEALGISKHSLLILCRVGIQLNVVPSSVLILIFL